ncbi:type IV toxin-antitoxin system AbiEi family antitoxin [Cupriavidus metallidurans]|uniref:type IV toxin-antitoxin system AbiEi family antitoxin n=1 Tax=Cupriavidus metallidurans TaxID=119219 RepID=UPI001BFC47B5|nr:type IV toxin-antitoxin system AbiEi family antitoxin [Cupriavidus metallidurans]QWC91263.1 hypothetical protein KB891_27615 [Cupriavidus metallidurans]
MLKSLIPVNGDDGRAWSALRALLEQVPIIEIGAVHATPASENALDLTAHVRCAGQAYQLVCAIKSNGQPRYARMALLELRDYVGKGAYDAVPILIAPYLSPAVRHMCRDSGVGYLDLSGNARIAFGGVFIEREMSDKPAVEQRELKSLFKPKSALVLRAMLREPTRAWRVTELADATGVSLGHISNVRTGLLDREWARVGERGLQLSAPEALLDAWKAAYAAPAGESRRFYTPLHGKAFEDAARSALSLQGKSARAVFASFSAANWLAPYGRTGTQYFYADRLGLEQLQAALRLAPASKGENVVVWLPKDEGLFVDAIEVAPGAICTSPVQTYLDLSLSGERGEEAAEHLRRELLDLAQ